ncbi:GNAT family N-acetyltransferase [Alkalibacterium sp. s-m-22]|uniref:GNAT family N-acetyltransferase n=1 Tax=Alkalibacterium indicireducens TaxID=398758 RepID=A0ABP3KJW9_9LACT
MNQIIVKEAEVSDIAKIKKILHSTAVWLNHKGSEQWAGLLKGEDVHNIQAAVERKEVYLAYKDKSILGTFALWDKQTPWDIDLWGEEKSRKYLYLHRIALDSDQHGKNRGKFLLEAAQLIAKESGKQGIRLDCIAGNPNLNSFYQANEFEYVKTVHDYDNGEGLQDYNLYEWKVKKDTEKY